MTEEWSGRAKATLIDGTSVFQTPRDLALQEEVARELERCWRCKIVPFEPYDHIDWYAARHNRMIGLLELKIRSQSIDKYETVFLAVRKWMRLSFCSDGLAVPAVFVVKFTEGIFYTFVKEIDARNHQIIDPKRRDPGVNDMEPVIHVPTALLRQVRLLAVGEDPK